MHDGSLSTRGAEDATYTHACGEHRGSHEHPSNLQEGSPNEGTSLAGRPTHPPHEACDQDPCRWVAPDAGNGLTDFVSLPCNCLAAVSDLKAEGAIAGSQFLRRLSGSTLHPLPVRAHLAKNVLLI